ncbi:MAG: glycosyltransferase [bacterium]
MRKVVIVEYHPFNCKARLGNHQYAALFEKHGFQVLWISHYVSPFHLLKNRKRNLEKLKLWWRKGMQRTPMLREYCPLTLLPYYKAPILKSFTVLRRSLDFCIPPVQHVFDRFGFQRPDLVWIGNPVFCELVPKKVAPRKLFVRIADDNSKFYDVPESIIEAENRLLKKADCIFATSTPLFERLKKTFDGKVRYLPNGVDYDFFARPRGGIPTEYEGISSKKVIYVGALQRWFDVALVEKLVRDNPQTHFFLIGELHIDLSGLSRAPNCHVLGPRPYESIPQYLQAADVAIIPFKYTDLIRSVSPIKLYEYCAAGVPVVSRWWDELAVVNPPARLARTHEEFQSALRQALESDQMERDKLQAFAAANSWGKRFEEIMACLD